jgi:hypothetical protein
MMGSSSLGVTGKEIAVGLNMTTAGTATGTGIFVTKIGTVTAADSNTTRPNRTYRCAEHSTLGIELMKEPFKHELSILRIDTSARRIFYSYLVGLFRVLQKPFPALVDILVGILVSNNFQKPAKIS